MVRMEALKTDKVVFEISPRKRQDGFTLNSKTLLYPLWYTSLNQALGYARFLSRYEGCQIRILDETGQVSDVIEVDPRNSKRTNSVLKRLRGKPHP